MAPVEGTPKKSILKLILGITQMPRMRSSSGHCCLCVVGVFMFLAGIIMIAIGVCLILNYGLFDSELLPEELRNDEGKKIIGIVLTTAGLTAATISIAVSSFYLCTKSKTPTVEPHHLTKIPASARNNVNARNGVIDKKRTPGSETSKVAASSSSSSMHSNPMPINTRMRKKIKRQHKLGLKNKTRLEGIQEDSLSRKQSEIDMGTMKELVEGEDTPRSQSSQETTDSVNNTETKNLPPVFTIDGAEPSRDLVNVAESDVAQDNTSTESGYTDSVNTGSLDREEFENQVKNLTQ